MEKKKTKTGQKVDFRKKKKEKAAKPPKPPTTGSAHVGAP